MFVRMKNGIIYRFIDILTIGRTIIGYTSIFDKNALDGGTYIAKENIIAQADTIKELCDKFVWIVGEDKIITNKLEDMHINADIPFEVYGAIWTDKGLIYVAKMNEKGELELL